jgi:hypothetical protein
VKNAAADTIRQSAQRVADNMVSIDLMLAFSESLGIMPMPSARVKNFWVGSLQQARASMDRLKTRRVDGS